MRVPGYQPVAEDRSIQGDRKLGWILRMQKAVATTFSGFHRAMAAGLSFGDGVDLDNISGKWVEYATNGSANTEDAIAHDLNVVPVGFLVVIPPASGFIYRGSTSWTDTTIYLKCSAASQTARLFLLVPPKT